ncbi:hypothetical protein BCV53_15780 [Parageobacillus thermoglucosidasius]|uniref:Uncharacterized protein n=1 Tax=Parageobacillus thermoglucosidasius TaxID=1426 RepID=A0AAN0YRR8_PARTM|nr:hypothetical protein AOT13_15740 [Parageobacillus thermoglucosidasius]ANZ31419.1 hypothetical protein BCV53_15780 [Parageobacillus thermoglucosidasius]APM82156.1 hypothetical protein BCV54_15790 [Parageobacillus thermoglucosidasius]RDE25894.1 hypothetical protein DV712_02980 [Parageobacillus thermoglucosidasius]
MPPHITPRKTRQLRKQTEKTITIVTHGTVHERNSMFLRSDNADKCAYCHCRSDALWQKRGAGR